MRLATAAICIRPGVPVRIYHCVLSRLPVKVQNRVLSWGFTVDAVGARLVHPYPAAFSLVGNLSLLDQSLDQIIYRARLWYEKIKLVLLKIECQRILIYVGQAKLPLS